MTKGSSTYLTRRHSFWPCLSSVAYILEDESNTERITYDRYARRVPQEQEITPDNALHGPGTHGESQKRHHGKIFVDAGLSYLHVYPVARETGTWNGE